MDSFQICMEETNDAKWLIWKKEIDGQCLISIKNTMKSWYGKFSKIAQKRTAKILAFLEPSSLCIHINLE